MGGQHEGLGWVGLTGPSYCQLDQVQKHSKNALGLIKKV